MSEEFWMMAIAAVFSGLGNLVQVWRGGKVREDRDVSEHLVRSLSRRLLQHVEPVALQKVAGDVKATKRTDALLDRTVGIVISESMKRTLRGDG